MTKHALLPSLLALSLIAVASAQRPANAPATAPAGKAPDTVLLEELTWAEVRDLIKTGTTTIIVGTAGTEQKGPHMVDGEHKFVMEYTGEKIARAIGKTLFAPVVTYVPEGSWENPTGHMAKPGTITLPDDRFTDLLVNAGRSLKAGGFKTILFIGESGGNRNGMRDAALKLNDLWKADGIARAFWIDDYYTKSHAEQNVYVTQHVGIPADQIGGHANILDTSELLFVNPKHIRRARLAGNDYENNGVSGNNQSKSTPELGKAFLQIKIDNAVAQIKALMGGTSTRQQSEAPGEAGGAGRGGRGGRGQGGRGGAQGANAEPRTAAATMLTAPASKTPTQAPDTVFIDELTWEETRDAMKGGKTTVIVPTGGTEKNGYHMVIGKHNYVVAYAANVMARRLKNALVAPVLQYVPEGDPDRQNAGAISVPSPAYDMILDAAARSLKAHGFTDILFIGDSGPNQAGMTSVANKLNEEWKDAGTKVFALTGYYEDGREHYRAWLEAAYGYDDATVGSHAGISDTSQMLFVKPAGVRKDQIKPWGGPQDSGVSGDPVKSTADIGKMGIEFKVNAAINQYKLLKNPPQRGRGRGL
ncbi:MAG TPA: creatininase family protein [Vicinamibacterales bacterium]|nr:creatininase family protein [Vicinamibacterales bacterium]